MLLPIKRALKAIAVLSFGFVVTNTAFATSGHYAGLTGGMQITTNLRSNFIDSATGFSTSAKTIFKNGYNLGVVLGAKDFEYRYEVEMSYMNDHNDSLIYLINSPVPSTVSQPSVNGRLRIFDFMANFYYEFDDRSPDWAPYLGVGAGMEHIKLFLNSATASNHTTINENIFAYQGIFGINYHLDRRTDFIFDYRYLRTLGVQPMYRDSIAATRTGRRDELLNHVLKIGILYRF